MRFEDTLVSYSKIKSSHHIRALRSKSVPPASLANQHCFAVDLICRLVDRGWMLRAQRAVAIGSPFVVPSSQWRDLFTAIDKLVICHYILVSNVLIMFTYVFIDFVMGPLSITMRIEKLS